MSRRQPTLGLVIKTNATTLRPLRVTGGHWSIVAGLTPRIMGQRKPLGVYHRMRLKATTIDVMKGWEVDTAYRAYRLEELGRARREARPCLRWVMGGGCRQADGTAGLPSPLEMPCTPRKLRLVPMADSGTSPHGISRKPSRAAAIRSAVISMATVRLNSWPEHVHFQSSRLNTGATPPPIISC